MLEDVTQFLAMQLRFDDTNPIKEKTEYEDSIIEDLARMNIVPDRVSHTSDFFPEVSTFICVNFSGRFLS